MTPQPAAQQAAPLWRRILGSFLAAFVGWTPLVLLSVIIGLIDWRHTSVTGWGSTIAFAYVFGKFVFGTWLCFYHFIYSFPFSRYCGVGRFAHCAVLFAV